MTTSLRILIALILTGLCAGKVIAAGPAAPGGRVYWKAAWIWSEEKTSGTHDFVHFRKQFDLESVPATAPLHISAEREYALWINGEFVGRGPTISEPSFKRFDTYDVAARLRRGRNTLAVLVYHTTKTLAWSGGRTEPYAEEAAKGLIVQLQAGDIQILTDTTWKARPSEAWAKPTVRFGYYEWPEFFDARKFNAGWQAPDYDDGSWKQASLSLSGYDESLDAKMSQTSAFPLLYLIPSEITALNYTSRVPVTVMESGEVASEGAAPDQAAVRLGRETLIPLHAFRLDGLEAWINGQSQPLVLSPANSEVKGEEGERAVTVLLDFGRLMNGRVTLDLDAGEGTAIDIGYGYWLKDGGVKPDQGNYTKQADQYVTRDGSQQWQTFQWRHFRYLRLTFRNLNRPVTLKKLYAEEQSYPYHEAGSFTSSDATLNRVWAMSKRTVELCTATHLMDNPSRERLQFAGDCSGVLPAVWSFFGDDPIVRKYFKLFAEGQFRSGLYQHSSSPGMAHDRTPVYDHGLFIPYHLYNHYELYHDKALVAYMWPSIERLLALSDYLLDESGLLKLPPGRAFLDWADIDRREYNFGLNALLAEVFERCARLGRATGHTDNVDRWEERARQMKQALRQRWFDPQRGVFVDSLAVPVSEGTVSEFTHSVALMFGIADASQTARILANYEKSGNDWIQSSPGLQFWPTALVRAGRTDLALAWTRSRYAKAFAANLETSPELWEFDRKIKHGKIVPVGMRAVAQAAGLPVPWMALTEICGIKVGLDEVRITPQPGPLESFEGMLAAGRGVYRITYQRTTDKISLRVTAPDREPISFEMWKEAANRPVRINGEIRKPATIHKLQGATVYEIEFAPL